MATVTAISTKGGGGGKKSLEYICRDDMKHQYIDSNPCDFADRPKAEKYRGTYYNQSELTELFRAAKESEIYIPVLLAAYYGLRRSEVLGIKWSNIDFENGTIRIAHKVVE